MGKKKDKIRRKAIYTRMLKKEVPPGDDYAQHWMLMCKKDPDKMAMNYRKNLQPQRPDPKHSRYQYKQYNRPYRGEGIYLPDEWE